MAFPLKTVLNVSSFLWLGLCLVLTWQNGQQTASASQWLDSIVLDVLNGFGIHLDEYELDVFLRHWAHFVLFAIFGLLFWGGTGASPSKRMTVPMRLLLVAVPLILAFVAEIPKEWIEGRHLTWSEAWLNVFGTFCGMGIAQLIASLHAHLKKTKSQGDF